MSKKSTNSLLFFIILLTGLMRIPDAMHVTPWSNFSPVGAMALFGGAYFKDRWKASLFPLLTLLLGDILVARFVHDGKFGILYPGWYWIYSIYILIVLLGRWLLTKITAARIGVASALAAVLHWLLADFIMWCIGATDLRTLQPLPYNVEGLVQCYVQGFPLMLNFFLGTLGYCALMFGFVEIKKAASYELRAAGKSL